MDVVMSENNLYFLFFLLLSSSLYHSNLSFSLHSLLSSYISSFFSSHSLKVIHFSIFLLFTLFLFAISPSYSPPPLSSFFSLDIPSLFHMPCSFWFVLFPPPLPQFSYSLPHSYLLQKHFSFYSLELSTCLCFFSLLPTLTDFLLSLFSLLLSFPSYSPSILLSFLCTFFFPIIILNLFFLSFFFSLSISLFFLIIFSLIHTSQFFFFSFFFLHSEFMSGF
ncbi:unnamed protein product [Acanthosepion pharaonis]|uniref:Uncharacterized protein n=1 Tax=Acanthosepion pharaonis TaxID=158019 RepID=A0A812CL58_ACAPH|nr:unnamed protein product [Sepia pharaonis]